MRNLLIVLLLTALLIADVQSQKRKKKPRRREEIPAEVVPETVNNEPTTDAEAAKLRILLQQDSSLNEIDDGEMLVDPCLDKKCGPGRECIPGSDNKGRCVCLKSCPSEEDNRRRVCSNRNETWTSDCELYRARCLCDEEECDDPVNKHLHIDYYGECREMPPCSEEEMGDFPRRMRDWLFNVMREMADRRELSQHFLQLEREAERSSDDSKKSVTAAVWKWCDLDGHPHDKIVSRHELFPIRAPLLALEHCIAPFLDDCDSDNDHRITLKEWGTCLGVPADELEEKCDDVREANNSNDDE